MERKALCEKIAANARVVTFFGKVNGDLYTSTQEQLLLLASQSEKPITILFDSKGGDTLFAFQLGDLIKMLPCEVNGVVIEALSAACTVLQFCKKRSIIGSGQMLIHRVTAKPDDASLRFRDDELWEDKIKKMLEALRKFDMDLKELLVRRTGFSESEVLQWMQEKDELLSFFDAKEALRRKLVDEIISDDFKLF